MCTSISFVSTDQQEFLGRTQEYNIEFDYVALQFPRKYEIEAAASSWKTDYAVLGAGILQEGQPVPTIVDGVNEYGLSAVTQYFADEYCYSSVAEIEAAGKKPVYAEQVIFYLLSTCKDIAEVKEKLDMISVANASLLQKEGLPQHFYVKDASGKSIVIEPSVKLGFKVFDNEVGVMTNNPSFDWHLKNLRNYTSLSDQMAKDIQLGSATFPSFGKGSGLRGMPGDYTSPSRFVRAATLLQFSEATDSKHAINKGFHILDASDIVKGVIKLEDSLQYTQYTSIYNLTQREMYIRLYDNFTIQKITFDESKVDDQKPAVYRLTKEPNYHELLPR